MTKSKGIDLGTLQSDYEDAKKTHTSNDKALLRAIDMHDASNERLKKSKEALQQASRAVLN
jgi:hypothetical protein